MLAAELQALKSELATTLARLGVECKSSEENHNSSSDRRDSSPAAEPTALHRDWCRPRRRRTRNRNQSLKRWNRPQLMQELAAASEKRKNLEIQVQRQQQVQEQEQEECHSSRRSAWRAAIVDLQQQQAAILQQIEHGTIPKEDAAEEKEDDSQVPAATTDQRLRNQVPRPDISRSVEDNGTQYSIGGIVTLEPLSLSQRRQVSGMTSSRSGVSFHPAVNVSMDTRHPRPPYSNTATALSDVFSLQLKFAETMRKLEKSVQMRDQLLIHGGISNRPKGSTETTESSRRRRRQRTRSFEDQASINSSVMNNESHSSESFSSSAYSVSSLDSRSRPNQSMQLSRATTAETLAPCSSNTQNLPSNETKEMAPVSSHTTMLSPIEKNSRNSDQEDQTPNEQDSESHGTPTTGSNITTPTTGSDQKSASSFSKQVRFDSDAYSTPVLARKFTFDGISIDENDDEIKEEETASVFSFLGGSSFDSAELNDASFVRAFERFRRELKTSSLHSATNVSPASPPLARKLFPEESSTNLNKLNNSIVDTFHEKTEEDSYENVPEFSALKELSAEQLQERRRQLCLDIQAESAQLVLRFGGLQSGTTESENMEQTQHRLQRMREELQVINLRLTALT